MEKISRKICAVEVLSIRRTNEKLFLAGAILPILIYGLNFIFPQITPVVAIGGAGLFGHFYLKTQIAITTLVDKYEL